MHRLDRPAASAAETPARERSAPAAPITAVLTEALPEAFPFYHLGAVERLDTPEMSVSDARLAFPVDAPVLAFSFRGELRGWLLISLRGIPAEDHSLYAEMGNIIASQTADRLSRRSSKEVLISPPQEIPAARLAKWLAAAPEIARRRYVHRHEARETRLEVWLTGEMAAGHGEGSS